MAMTDLSTLSIPDPLRKHLRSTSRAVTIVDHNVTINPQWWLDVLSEQGLPGGPVLFDGHSGTGEPTLSRGALFSLARSVAVSADEDVLGLLWHVLAWGAGAGGRNNRP